ncbi:syntaxin-7-like [Sycon ciliatum]|uniref:syntaxin-7-like n=1 Tax=Sycon ciliatum TaxID=27933 RepID=UPI0020AA1E96|eukprot:scpid78655/ scgid25626/ Syntaxin
MARRYEEGGFSFASAGGRSAESSSGQTDVGKELQEISGMNRRFTAMIGKIGGTADSGSLRKQIHELQSMFTRSVKSAKTSITQQVKSSDSAVKLQGNRFLQSLQGEVTAFEESLKELRNKEQRYPATNFASSASTSKGDFSFEYDDDRGGQAGGTAATDNFAAQRQADMQDIERRQEDHDALMNLEGDMRDLHTMFVDMAALVNDQGEMVDHIEDNIASAEMKVEAAADSTRQAATYQSKARRKKVMCAIILGTVLVVIIVVVVVVTTKK